MKTLKVYGGHSYMNFKQFLDKKPHRAIVAAYTQKQVIEIAGISMSELRNYWSETGNKRELETATEVGMWVYDGNEFHKDTKLVKVK